MKCLKCKCRSVRIHSSHHEIARRRRFWLFGPEVYVVRRVGFDLSCSECLYAWTEIHGDLIEAPLQAAHEMLKHEAEQKETRVDRPAPPRAAYDRDMAPDPRDEEARKQRRWKALQS